MDLNGRAGQREKMVRTQLIGRGIADPRVLAAFRKVPRHQFVPEHLRHRAYDDNPLPIGENQTISQPYTVAAMTEALGLRGGEVVLEVGTGSGYQTAILAELCEWVYSVERIRELSQRARKALDGLGYRNVGLLVGDGTLGWREHAPYDAVIVTAGAPDIPRPLVEQLREGGRIVVPVGGSENQAMTVGVKKGAGLELSETGAYRFVELIGAYGWKG